LTDETLTRTSETINGKRKNYTKFELLDLASGKSKLKSGWNNIALKFEGKEVELLLNGKSLGKAECKAEKGTVAIGCDYQPVSFDNLKIERN
jgi:hypothetical protein